MRSEFAKTSREYVGNEALFQCHSLIFNLNHNLPRNRYYTIFTKLARARLKKRQTTALDPKGTLVLAVFSFFDRPKGHEAPEE